MTIEVIDSAVDENTGETISIHAPRDVTPSGKFCGSASVPTKRGSSKTESRAYVYDGTFQSAPQINAAYTMNEAGDIARFEELILAGTDQVLHVTDLLDTNDPNYSILANGFTVMQLGPRIDGCPQIIGLVNVETADGSRKPQLMILDPIVAQP